MDRGSGLLLCPIPLAALVTGAATWIGQKIAERLALARAISSADVAGAVVYLATARNVTGQTIAVDAGQHLAWRTAAVVQ